MVIILHTMVIFLHTTVIILHATVIIYCILRLSYYILQLSSCIMAVIRLLKITKDNFRNKLLKKMWLSVDYFLICLRQVWQWFLRKQITPTLSFTYIFTCHELMVLHHYLHRVSPMLTQRIAAFSNLPIICIFVK